MDLQQQSGQEHPALSPLRLSLVEAACIAGLSIVFFGVGLVTGVFRSIAILAVLVGLVAAALWILIGTLVGRGPVMLRVWPRLGVFALLTLAAAVIAVAGMAISDANAVLTWIFIMLFNVPMLFVTGVVGIAVAARIVKRRR